MKLVTRGGVGKAASARTWYRPASGPMPLPCSLPDHRSNPGFCYYLIDGDKRRGDPEFLRCLEHHADDYRIVNVKSGGCNGCNGNIQGVYEDVGAGLDFLKRVFKGQSDAFVQVQLFDLHQHDGRNDDQIGRISQCIFCLC